MKYKSSKKRKKKKRLQMTCDADLMSLDYDTVFFRFHTLDSEIIFMEMFQN